MNKTNPKDKLGIQKVDISLLPAVSILHGAHKMYDGAFLAGPAISAGVPVVASARNVGATTTFRVNGSVIGTRASSTNPSQIAFGCSGVFSEPLDGDIFELAIYTINHTEGQMDTMNAYFRAKYAL